MNVEDVYERVGKVIASNDPLDIAKALYATSSQIKTNWKNRKRIPAANLIQFCLDHNISIAWLLTGEEKPDNRPAMLTQKALDQYPFLEKIAYLTNDLAEEDIDPLTYINIMIKYIEGMGLRYDALKKKRPSPRSGATAL